MSAIWSELHFLRPLWLLGLLMLPVLLQRWRVRHEASDPWRQVCDPHLLEHLRDAARTQGGHAGRSLFVLGYIVAVVALAGPAFRQLPETLARAESALVVALDLSERMRATDIKPDRLSRARFKIADLLKSRREGQTALIAYAGDAFVVAPLTDDAGSLSDLLASLTPETMPVGGQRPDRAIALARRLVRDAGFSEGDVLIVSDAADERASEAAESAAREGLRISVLGVGTDSGGPIALAQGGFMQDRDGAIWMPRLETPALRDLAAAGGGRFATLSVDASDLSDLGLVDATFAAKRLQVDERTRADYRDEGPWLLLLLLPLAALAFRRGWLGCVMVAMLVPTPRVEAMEWSGLWKRPDQRAWDALQAQDATRAMELARDPALRGTAAYRSEDFDRAAAEFSAEDAADAHYNRGNALARSERFEEAIAAYEQALEHAPDMEDAHANRQAVQDWLDQQEMKEKQDAQDQSQPGSEGDSGESEPQSGDAQQQQSPQSDAQDSPEGDARQREDDEGESGDSAAEDGEDSADETQAEKQFAEQMEQALKEGTEQEPELRGEAVDPHEAEKQQAVEQWLRRVPDDPGGLLRRKFALEYQRRQREGGGDRP